MSSYSKSSISKNIKVSTQPFHVSDRAVNDSESFVKSVVQQMIEESKERIKKREEEILKELEVEKQQKLYEGYLEGNEKAMQDASHMVRSEWEERFKEVENLYDEANDYYKGFIKNSEKIRNQYLMEKQSEVMDFVLLLFKKMLNQNFERDMIDLEGVYNHIMNQIDHETKKVFVKVHPDVLQKITTMDLYERNKNVEWIGDISLEVMDFVLETEREFIDLKLGTQIKEILKVIRGVIHDGFENGENQERNS